ncbi:hypothetical protein FACS189411_14850 [Bacteroidia bacterium]|nr:hypothetical protein FACS189411_14850 [Bacteroidia bacterium]
MKNERKIVGKVTIEERDEIRMLYEKKNGLVELFNILTKDKCELYDRIVQDLGETTLKFQDWWNRNSQKYDWEKGDNSPWNIDFNTCEIYLIVK